MMNVKKPKLFVEKGFTPSLNFRRFPGLFTVMTRSKNINYKLLLK